MSDESRHEEPNGLEFESKRFDRRKFMLGATGLIGGAAFSGADSAFAEINRALANPLDHPGPAPTWPTLPAFPAANFLDHFRGPSLDLSKWAPVVTGTGTVTVNDSYVGMVAPPNSAAFIHYKTKLDKAKSQLWLAAMSSPRALAGSGCKMVLVNGASAPTADTLRNTNAKIVAEHTLGIQDVACIGNSYFDNGGIHKFWDGSGQSWVAYGPTIKSALAEQDDYYVFGIEIDGPRSRWRLLVWCQAFATAGTWTFNQGWRMFALTDWVSWASTRDSTHLWLCFGQLVNSDPSARENRVEWVRYAEARPGNTVLDAWLNAGPNVFTNARLKHCYSYDGLTFLPQDRTTWAIDWGKSGAPDQVNIATPWAVHDGANTDYLFYMGTSAAPASFICMATAPHASPQNGPWTKYASNPILSQGASGANDDQMITAPCVFIDRTEKDSAKRWKMLYSGKKASDGKWRILYATAPSPTGPWTKRGVAVNVGGAGAGDEKSASGAIVLYFNNQWEVWYVGVGANNVGKLMRATGTDFLFLTKQGTVYSPVPTATDQALTANLNTAPGRSVTVGSTAGFQVDAEVVLSQSASRDIYSVSRIRKIVSSRVLELYHGLTGLLTAYPTRIKQLDSCPNIAPRAIVQVGSEWWFYITFWEPFDNTANAARYRPLLEENHLLKHQAVAPSGATPAMQYLPSPVTSRGFNNDQESAENMTLLLNPFGG